MKQQKTRFSFYLIFVLLACLFGVHRVFVHLLVSYPFDNWTRIVHFLVGFGSDLWVAFLLCVLLQGVLFWSPRTLANKKKVQVGFLFLMTFICYLHLSYVQYFQTNFLPFHFWYMFDSEFIAAESSHFFNGVSFIQVGFHLLLAYFIFRIWSFKNRKRQQAGKLKPGLLFFAFLLSITGIHSLNIRYRIQTFTPRNLQMNFIEDLFAQLENKSVSKALSVREVEGLGGSRAAEASKLESEVLVLETLLGLNKELGPGFESSPLASLKEFVQERERTTGRRVQLGVVLLESRRFIDTEFADGGLPSPDLVDALRGGVFFKQAYSSGTVTRGAQESVWCGFPGAIGYSTMRSLLNIKLDCLTRKLGRSSAFFHGGAAAFDNQAFFWKNQGVSHILTENGFSEGAAKTPWGVADEVLFHKAFKEIMTRYETTITTSYDDYMLLSITNHSPWVLPEPQSQISRELQRVAPDLSGHFRTGRYSDKALKMFVGLLRKSDLWKDTLILFVGDHGHLLESKQKTSTEEKLSHVPMGIIGGLVESWLQESSELQALQYDERWPEIRFVEHFVSQMDISYVSHVLRGLSLTYQFGADPFVPRAIDKIPVFSNLGDRVYFSSTGEVVPKHELFKKQQADSDRLKAKAVLRLLDLWNAGKKDLSNKDD